MDKVIFESLVGPLEAQIERAAADAAEAQTMADDATANLERLKTALQELSELAPEGAATPIILVTTPVVPNLDAVIAPKATKPSKNGSDRPKELTERQIQARILRGLMGRGKRTRNHTTSKRHSTPGVPVHQRAQAHRILNELVGNSLVATKKSHDSAQYWITDTGVEYFNTRLTDVILPKQVDVILRYITQCPGKRPVEIASACGYRPNAVNAALTVELRKPNPRIIRTSISTYYMVGHPDVARISPHA